MFFRLMMDQFRRQEHVSAFPVLADPIYMTVGMQGWYTMGLPSELVSAAKAGTDKICRVAEQTILAPWTGPTFLFVCLDKA